MARAAEATNWMSRHITLMLFRWALRYTFFAVSSVKSLISPATPPGMIEQSNICTCEMPPRPDDRLSQNASRPMPIGLMMPSPVMTTLRGELESLLIMIRVGNPPKEGLFAKP